MSESKSVTIYTDGACRGNPGPGGYGVILIYGAARKELSAGYRWTTNNRMELLALIVALQALKKPCRADIFSDSQYVLGAYTKKWIAKWKANGWQTSARQPVQNQDLWLQLDQALKSHEPTFHWVKGHAANPLNNRCDELATTAARRASLLVDEAYEALHPYKRTAS